MHHSQSQLTGITMTSAAVHELLVKQDGSIAHEEAAAQIKRQQFATFEYSCEMIDHNDDDDENEDGDDDDENDSSRRRKRRSCRFIDDEAADAGDEDEE